MGKEDLSGDVANGEDGAGGRSQEGTTKPGDASGSGVPGSEGSAATGPDSGETTGRSGAGPGNFDRGSATLDGVEADGVAF